MSVNNLKLCLTGGHISPCIAVVEEIQLQKLKWDLNLIGRDYIYDNNRITAEERKISEKYNIKFFAIRTGKLSFDLNFGSILSLIRVPVGIYQAYKILKKIKPNLILSFGGYIAFSVDIAAFFLNIPIVIHEQTNNLGMTNRLISIFAKKVLLTNEKDNYKNEKFIYTGLPLKNSILNEDRNKEKYFDNNKPILLILGGSQGSVRINNFIYNILPKLLEKYNVIHQTGDISFKKLNDFKNNLVENKKSNYKIYSFIDDEILGKFYKISKIVIARSGANTVSECEYLKKVCIFIPLSNARDNEQFYNAKRLQDNGCCEIVIEKNLIESNFFDVLTKVENNYNNYLTNYDKHKSKNAQNVRAKIIKEIQSI